MLPAFLLGLSLVIGVVLIARWFVAAEPKQVAKAVAITAVAIAAALTVFLAATGRLGWAMGAAAFALPAIIRLIQAGNMLKTLARMAGLRGGLGGGLGGGRKSRVDTAGLRMTLDHDSGLLDGEVTTGGFAGQRLSDLSLDDLLALRVEWQHETDTRQVLEAFLDRAHPDWRARAGSAAGAGDGARGSYDHGARSETSGAMTREEALAILGLEDGSSTDEIKSAHHRLIAGLHPDRGGSTWLAARVNEARRTLLGR